MAAATIPGRPPHPNPNFRHNPLIHCVVFQATTPFYRRINGVKGRNEWYFTPSFVRHPIAEVFHPIIWVIQPKDGVKTKSCGSSALRCGKNRINRVNHPSIWVRNPNHPVKTPAMPRSSRCSDRANEFKRAKIEHRDH